MTKCKADGEAEVRDLITVNFLTVVILSQVARVHRTHVLWDKWKYYFIQLSVGIKFTARLVAMFRTFESLSLRL